MTLSGKMRICVVTDFFIPHYNGGGERKYYELLRRLVKRGHKVDLVCMRLKGVPDFEDIEGIRVHHVGPAIAEPPKRAKLDFLGFLLSASAWLLSHEYDIVEANPWIGMIPVSLFGGRKGAAKLTTVHDVSSGASDQWLGSSSSAERAEKFLIRLPFHRIICISKIVRQKLIENFGIRPEKLKLIYPGVDLKLFDSVKSGEKEKDTVVFIGRLIPHKHVDDLINAVNLLKEKHKGIKLKVIGTGQEVDSLVRQVGQLKLERHVRFLGSIDYTDLVRELKKSEVLALPSTREGFGMVLVEAFACHVPCVAYYSDGVVDIIEDGKNGFLVEQRNVAQLADRISSLLKNKKKAEKFARNGRRKTERLFNWELAAAELEAFYKSLLRK
jgi:glycosyltransferase involved in cell wall biosynthesis